MTVAQNSTLQGYSSVTSTVVSQPVVLSNMTYQVSAGNLVFSGSGGAGAANLTYYLLGTTNLSAPNWTPVMTNMFDPSGNFRVTNAIDATKPQQFFRLAVPQ
jgi:hypothetical protein